MPKADHPHLSSGELNEDLTQLGSRLDYEANTKPVERVSNPGFRHPTSVFMI